MDIIIWLRSSVSMWLFFKLHLLFAFLLQAICCGELCSITSTCKDIMQVAAVSCGVRQLYTLCTISWDALNSNMQSMGTTGHQFKSSYTRGKKAFNFKFARYDCVIACLSYILLRHLKYQFKQTYCCLY